MDRESRMSRYSKRSKFNLSLLNSGVFGPKSKSAAERQKNSVPIKIPNQLSPNFNDNLEVKHRDNHQKQEINSDEDNNQGYHEDLNNENNDEEGISFPSDRNSQYNYERENGPPIIIRRASPGRKINKRELNQNNKIEGDENEGEDYAMKVGTDEKKIGSNTNRRAHSNDSSSQSENFQFDQKHHNTEYGENEKFKTRFQSRGIINRKEQKVGRCLTLYCW